MLIGLLSGMLSSYLTSYATVFHSKITEALITKQVDDIYKFMYLFYSYNLLGNILAGMRGCIFTTYIQIVSSRIKKDILLSFFSKNILSFSHKSPSEVADILIEDTNHISDLYCLNANIFIRDFAQFATIAYILLPISWELFVANIFLAVLQLTIEHNYHTYIYEKSVEKCNKLLVNQKELVHDYTHKTDTYKSLGMEDDVLKKWEHNESDYTNIKRTEAYYYGFKVVINQSINQSMILILIMFGMWRNIVNEDIIIFLLYNPSLCNIIADLIYIRTDITKKQKSLKNIGEVFNNSGLNEWTGTYIPNENVLQRRSTPTVRLENISFSYSENVPILENINLTFHSGKIIGIRGQSGRGKSTLLKLLLGLYKPTNGSILFDYVKMEDFDKEYFYSKLISFVGQEPVLFNGTTLDNITSNIDECDLELLESMKHLIKDIPEHTKMSGGQRQRVAICRAFLRKPKILLLDEPTSALDSKNEQTVLTMIKEIHSKMNITVIIVSHKNTTLEICDTIVDL